MIEAAPPVSPVVSLSLTPLTPVHPKETSGTTKHTGNSNGTVFQVRAGMKIKLRAEALFADGGRKDVTSDPETAFQAVNGTVAFLPEGEVEFVSAPEQPSELLTIVARYRAATASLAFAVFPALPKNEVLTDLRIQTTPPVPMDHSKEQTQRVKEQGEHAFISEGTVFTVPAGLPVQLHVEAVFADGSQRDVTTDPATLYGMEAPKVATVSPTGQVKFPAGGPPAVATILVAYGARTLKMLTFQTQAKETKDIPVKLTLSIVPPAPPLEESAAEKKCAGRGLVVSMGSRLQLRAEATFADASQRDVTNSPFVSFGATDGHAVTSPTGEVTFPFTSIIPSWCVSVGARYGTVTDGVHFNIISESKTK